MDTRLDRAERTLGLPPRAFLDPAPRGGRSRADLMWHEGRLGLRGPSDAGGGWRFAPPEERWLRQLDSELPNLFEAFAASHPPRVDMQVRFRIAPDGRRGLWLDLSREGIAAIVSSGGWLSRLLDDGWIIELGQRGEGAVSGPDGPVLQPAFPYSWLPAWTPEGEALPLECLVASFSQPGPRINRALTDAAGALLDAESIETPSWCEWGAGYGNLTAWCSRRLGPSGTALEGDGRAAGLLRENAPRFFPGIAVSAARVARGMSPPVADLWLLDPPRNGFATLLERLPDLSQRPAHVLALHCHQDGLAGDATALRSASYRLLNWIAVNAFPGTDHLEVVSLWGSDDQA
ncbi:MAG: hypothetical protein SGI90_14360 [Candidatus Eisenbacteria bacterium]|nr:hypothetical protein [Candidatus Eisenbacteria bacterium]